MIRRNNPGILSFTVIKQPVLGKRLSNNSTVFVQARAQSIQCSGEAVNLLAAIDNEGKFRNMFYTN